ncbi:MAG: CcmD family protein [Fidelibacterota bacterium]
MKNLPYLISAYTIIWTYLCGYLISLILRRRKAVKELNYLAELKKDEI